MSDDIIILDSDSDNEGKGRGQLATGSVRSFQFMAAEEIVCIEESFTQRPPKITVAEFEIECLSPSPTTSKSTSSNERVKEVERRVEKKCAIPEAPPTKTNINELIDNLLDSDDDEGESVGMKKVVEKETVPKFVPYVAEKNKGNDEGVEKKGRKRARDDGDKEAKEKARLEAQKQRLLTKNMKESDKLRARIEREISASKKSQCEKYMFCHVGKPILDNIDGLEVAAKMAFLERNMENQLKTEGAELEYRVEWHRKCIEVIDKEDGGIDRFEYTNLQHFFLLVVQGTTLADLAKADCLMDWVQQQKASFPIFTSNMVIVAFGDCPLSTSQFTTVNLDLFESYRTQLKKCSDVTEFSQYLVQLTRSLSRLEGKKNWEDRVILDMEKGIRHGTDLVSDWWNRMLDSVARMSDANRRAIIRKIPHPIRGIDWVQRVGFAEAHKELMNTMAENNRRVGPHMAHRVITMLSNMDGEELME